MLGRKDDRSGTDGLVVSILKRNLRFRIRLDALDLAAVAGFGQSAQNSVRVEDWRGHQRFGFAGRVAEHNPLVAGAFVFVLAGINTLRDVDGLLVQLDIDLGGLPVEAFLFITDGLYGLTGDAFDVIAGDGVGAARFAGYHNRVRRHQRFTGNAGFGVFAEIKVDDSVRNTVAHLVRVTLGDGFASENIILKVGVCLRL